jgi:hypothetical protein
VARKRASDAQIAKLLIDASLSSYPGNCPCPYNTDAAGHACGRRSAYSRAGGYEPVCFRKDVTPGMIVDWRVINEPVEATAPQGSP